MRRFMPILLFLALLVPMGAARPTQAQTTTMECSTYILRGAFPYGTEITIPIQAASQAATVSLQIAAPLNSGALHLWLNGGASGYHILEHGASIGIASSGSLRMQFMSFSSDATATITVCDSVSIVVSPTPEATSTITPTIQPTTPGCTVWGLQEGGLELWYQYPVTVRLLSGQPLLITIDNGISWHSSTLIDEYQVPAGYTIEIDYPAIATELGIVEVCEEVPTPTPTPVVVTGCFGIDVDLNQPFDQCARCPTHQFPSGDQATLWAGMEQFGFSTTLSGVIPSRLNIINPAINGVSVRLFDGGLGGSWRTSADGRSGWNNLWGSSDTIRPTDFRGLFFNSASGGARLYSYSAASSALVDVCWSFSDGTPTPTTTTTPPNTGTPQPTRTPTNTRTPTATTTGLPTRTPTVSPTPVGTPSSHMCDNNRPLISYNIPSAPGSVDIYMSGFYFSLTGGEPVFVNYEGQSVEITEEEFGHWVTHIDFEDVQVWHWWPSPKYRPGTYTFFSLGGPATLWTCDIPRPSPTPTITPTYTPTPRSVADLCVPVATPPPAQTGQIPQLSLLIPSLEPIPTWTPVGTVTASLVISPVQTFVSGWIQPIETTGAWVAGEFGPNGYARASADVAPVAAGVSAAFGWFAVIGQIGPLAWLVPALLITLIVRIAKPILSLIKYIKQLIPFN